MKTSTGILLIVFGFAFAISRGIFGSYAHYKYANEIGCNWELSEKAATIPQKSEYIDKFVASLEKCNLDGTHDAIFYPNDGNSFTANMKALKSLQSRLHDISKIDENSFAYQTAMQQITAQEQGEAQELLDVLYSCWQKDNYYTLWNWMIFVSFLIIQILTILIGLIIIND